MTEKELLYMEDAINHENSLIEICHITIDNIQDKNLKTFIKNELKKHQNMKIKLTNILEDLAND